MKNTEEQAILLIEDNPGDIRLIKEMLTEITSFNYKLIVAENLKDGCEQIRKNNFILILLDLNLPDSTGKHTFDKVMQIAENIPIVLVSGMKDIELSLSLIQKGAQDYIEKKDLNSSLLARTIQYALIRKRAEEEIRMQLEELQRWHLLIIDRESRIIEIKQEVNELLKRLGEPIRYPSEEKDASKDQPNEV